MEERKWLPNLSELIDRLSIHQLKEVFLEEHKDKYRKEMSDIVHDIDLLLESSSVSIDASMIRIIIIVAQINTHIWYNESKARKGDSQSIELLRLTHGLNGIRNRAGNYLLCLLGEEGKRDYKTDCLAADHAQWNIDITLKGVQDENE